MKDKNWSIHHEKLYSMLLKYYQTLDDNIDENTFINDKKRYLMSIINNNNNWGDSSKEGLFFMIARYLIIDNPNDKYVKIYQQLGYDLMQKNRNKENENQQDEKEKENYRTHEYFINLLNSINPDEIKTKLGHYQYLLLSLLVLQPPLRTSFYITCKFIRNMKDNDKKNNYIWISKRGSLKIYYIVNNDKVTKTKIYAMNKQLSYIKINDENLVKLIYYSYEKYPRNYLFEIDGKPITQPTYLSWLRKISNVKNINNDIMRSSYINWFYDNHKKLSEREKLANEMRHSVMTSQRNYRKVIDNNITNNELKNKIELLDQQLKTCESKNIIDDKLYKKRRRDIIYNINKKGTSPKEDTLKKYNIVYDDNKKLYV